MNYILCLIATATLIKSVFSSTGSVDYKLKGKNWSEGACKDGKAQSPIDINTNEVERSNEFDFEISYSLVQNNKVELTEATIILNMLADNQGALFLKQGESKQLFKVRQFHFHAPSEHTINGKYYDAELHIVHSSFDTNDLTVVGILFDSSKDIEATLLSQSRMVNLTNGNATTRISPMRSITNASVQLQDYVKRMGKSFYHYKGSLTTPPCNEVVNWIVMKEVQYMSLDQMAVFQRLWGGNRTFANGNGNNREVQPLNGRKVYFRDVSLDEHFEELSNHFMLPESFGIGQKMSLLIMIVTVINYF